MQHSNIDILNRLRHKQAKEVVLSLRASIAEKDIIIQELKDQAQRKAGSAYSSLQESLDVTPTVTNSVFIFVWEQTERANEKKNRIKRHEC